MALIRIAATVAFATVLYCDATLAQELQTVDEALVIYMEDEDGELDQETLQDVLTEAIVTHLPKQDVYMLNRERRDFVKFEEIYPHFSCVAAQPARQIDQSESEISLFASNATYASQFKGQGYCPETLVKAEERLESVEVLEGSGYNWAPLEIRLRQHLTVVQSAAAVGDLVYVDICPRIHQHRTPVYARAWLSAYVEELKDQVRSLASESYWIFWDLVERDLDIRDGAATITFAEAPKPAGEARRAQNNRIDLRVHSGPADKEFTACVDQDGHFGKANHFSFHPGQTIQALWEIRQTATGMIPDDEIAARRADLLSAFDTEDLAASDKKLVYVIEGYESLPAESSERKLADHTSTPDDASETTNYSLQRARSLLPFVEANWDGLAVAGYGQTNILKDHKVSTSYYFDATAAEKVKKIYSASESVRARTEEKTGEESELQSVTSTNQTLQIASEDQNETEKGLAPIEDESEQVTPASPTTFPTWGVIPESLNQTQLNQTAFLSVFLLDETIVPTRPNKEHTHPAFWIARAQAANAKTCVNPEKEDHLIAGLNEITTYFQGKQFAPFAEIPGLKSSVILICSNQQSAAEQESLQAHQLASPLARAFAATEALDANKTHLGFLHSVNRSRTKDYYMFGNSLLTHFMPQTTANDLEQICGQHPSISIQPDSRAKDGIDFCSATPDERPTIEKGALHHITSNASLSWFVARNETCEKNLLSLPEELPVDYQLEESEGCLGASVNPLVLFEALKSNDRVFRLAIDVAFSLSEKASASK